MRMEFLCHLHVENTKPVGEGGCRTALGFFHTPGVFASLEIRATAQPQLRQRSARGGHQTPPLPIGAAPKALGLSCSPVGLRARDFCK